MPFIIPFIVKAIVSVIVSVAVTSTGALVGKVLGGTRKLTGNLADRSNRQLQNITSTIESIPVVYGRARVGGSVVYMSVTGDILNQDTVFCEGPIEEIESVLVDGVDSRNQKFISDYELDIMFRWVYAEPLERSQSTSKQVPFTSSLRLDQKVKNQFGAQPEASPINEEDRYLLLRSPRGANTYKPFWSAPKGKQEINIKNTRYGEWDFRLIYKLLNGSQLVIGEASVILSRENEDFRQSITRNLFVRQNSRPTQVYIREYKRLGEAGQEAIPELVKNAPRYGSDRVAYYLAHVGHRFINNQARDRFPRLPVVTAIIRGRKVYDPRSGETLWSENPALCLLDYLTNNRYGVGIPFSRVDLDSFQDAANFCEQLIEDSDGQTRPRYTLNGFLDTRESVADNLERLLSSCAGRLTYVMGTYQLQLDRPEPVSFTFDQDLIVGGISLTKSGIRARRKYLNVKFLSPENNWQTDIIALSPLDGSPVQPDQGEEIELPFTTDRRQAIRLGQIQLRAAALSLKVQFSALLSALTVSVGDVVNISHPSYGWEGKRFRVSEVFIQPTGLIDFSLDEYSEDVYTSAPFIPKDDPGFETTLGSPYLVEIPGIPTLSQSFKESYTGQLLVDLVLRWEAPAAGEIALYQLEYKPEAGGIWKILGQTTALEYALSQSLPPGFYDFRVKAINRLGAASAYATLTAEILDTGEKPPKVPDFTLISGLEQISLKWGVLSGIQDNGYYRLRHSPKTSGALWEDSPTLDLLLDSTTTQISLPAIKGTYMIKAANRVGQLSEEAASQLYQNEYLSEFELIATNQADPLFEGLHNNTTLNNGRLELITLPLTNKSPNSIGTQISQIDPQEGSYHLLGPSSYPIRQNTSIYNATNQTLEVRLGEGPSLLIPPETPREFPYYMGLFSAISPPDVSGKVLVTEQLATFPLGHPNFASYDHLFTTDLGGVYQVRLVREYEAEFLQTNSNWDDQTVQVDDITGLLDGEATINAILNQFFRVSDDLLNWSDWQPLTVNEVQGRAFQFKAELISDSLNLNIRIGKLRALLYLKKRIQSQSLSINSPDQRVDFTSPFYQIPSLLISIENALSGDYFQITDLSTTGFRITTRTAGGAFDSRLIQYLAQGV